MPLRVPATEEPPVLFVCAGELERDVEYIRIVRYEGVCGISLRASLCTRLRVGVRVGDGVGVGVGGVSKRDRWHSGGARIVQDFPELGGCEADGEGTKVLKGCLGRSLVSAGSEEREVERVQAGYLCVDDVAAGRERIG